MIHLIYCYRSREYVDCVGHIRVLSWLLLGSLTHIATYAHTNNSHSHGPMIQIAQPIPQEVSCNIADHIQVILSGFPEQLKASVLHLPSLFYAFILCQVFYSNRLIYKVEKKFLHFLLIFFSYGPCI